MVMSVNSPVHSPIMDQPPSHSGSSPLKVGFYEIEETIGRGNFAVVKLARHRITKTEVCIVKPDNRPVKTLFKDGDPS